MYLILWILLILVFANLLWRFASKRFSLPCPVWLHRMVEMDNPFTRTNRASEIIRLLNIQPGMSVLDAGCGPGRLTLPLARSVGECGNVTALDVQQGMLDRVRKKIMAQGAGNVDLVEGGLGDGILPRKRFDRALLVTVLGEIPEKARAIDEIFGALKPGGVLSVTEVIFDPHFLTMRRVAELAEKAGFIKGSFFGHKLAYTYHFIKPGGREPYLVNGDDDPNREDGK